MRFSGILIIIFSVFFSCKKTTVNPPEAMLPMPPPANTGTSLQLNINNVANGKSLILGAAGSYTTANSDTFYVNLLKYYISNVSLTNSAGQTFTVPESYFLIDQSDSTSGFTTIQNIPADDYSSISFMVGVDAARNTSGAQTGALDPLYGMFWGWNTGYIMAKMEGYSRRSAAGNKTLFFHIGGYTGKFTGVRTVTLNLPINVHIQEQHLPKISIAADLAKWFSGTHALPFSSVYNVTSLSQKSQDIADNYANMFTVTAVVN